MLRTKPRRDAGHPAKSFWKEMGVARGKGLLCNEAPYSLCGHLRRTPLPFFKKFSSSPCKTFIFNILQKQLVRACACARIFTVKSRNGETEEKGQNMEIVNTQQITKITKSGFVSPESIWRGIGGCFYCGLWVVQSFQDRFPHVVRSSPLG